jgi:uncharacterized membrane protein
MTVADRSSESRHGSVEGAASRAPTEGPPPPAPLTGRRAWITAVILAAAVVLWGGYSRHWAWTGINGRTATLWDWLHLLALPFAVGVLPIWLSHRTRVHRPHRTAALALLGAFAALVTVGYLVPWAWTGFAGNTLWDWLNLVALPLTVALMPVYREVRQRWNARHSRLTAVVLGLFAVAVLEGYVGDWSWTGFAGNTLWDWLHLLLLPLLLPTIVVPSLRPLLTAGVIYLEAEETEEAEEHGHGGGG